MSNGFKHSLHPGNRLGFTLIELSIVLAILSLLVGSIMVAQSMIRNSQLRAVTAEVQQYTQMANDFRDKYNALPGDFSGATALWGSPNSNYICEIATGATAGISGTCDGNGDGQISYTDASGSTNIFEIYRAWQHLANAGMINGSFTGISTAMGAFGTVFGTNLPSSKLDGGGYTLRFINYPNGNGTKWWPVMGHVFVFGSNISAAGVSDGTGPAITPSEALSIDRKIDDGFPATGKIMGFMYGLQPNCVTTNVSTTAAYNISGSGKQCTLIFTTGF